MKSYVEHANMSVVDAQKTIHFLTSAIPEWRVRGGGKLDNGFHGGKAYWYRGTQCGCGGRTTRVSGLRFRSLGW